MGTHGWVIARRCGSETLAAKTSRSRRNQAMSPVSGRTASEPGKIVAPRTLAETPRCSAMIPLASARRSVVGFRSRPSNSWAGARPGQSATTRPPFTAPPDTPREIVEKLSAGIRTAFQAPDAAKRLADLRATAVLNTPAEAGRIFKQDSERWGAVIKANNIKGE